MHNSKVTKKHLLASLLMTCSIVATGVVEAKTYNIGTDATFPPFEYMENNKPAGFDIDILSKILEQSGDEANFIDTRFSNLISGLRANKFDILISGLYITPERLKIVDMVPYYKTTESVLVAKDSAYQPKGKMDLCGKTVASIKGSKFPEQLAKISTETCVPAGKPAISVREFTTSAEGIQAVLAKAVDAHYDDTSVAQSLAEKLHGRVVISSTDSFFPILGGIAVRKGDTAMLEKLTKGLEAIKSSGVYEQLVQKYRLQAPTAEDITNYMPK
ncbi:ABC transporter substrate-binding protein [Pelistega europaea]|uniref:ABC transporter substrate-binding protein n=1 Tax=Pelistega europaea TaxID=106147 RepID=A0A7Y4L7P6_9BURK|nr:ABC transporter substrate-binding protein [Pelistega europaea]NOL48535.1 ABC transporter substrate-binding protein [Pelistega europaea]